MRKIILTIIVLILCSALVACNGKSNQNVHTLRIGVTTSVYHDLVEKALTPGLEEKGYHVEIFDIVGNEETNQALLDNGIDVNIFQSKAYFDSYIEEKNVELVDLITVPTAPFGIYSNQVQSLSEIKDHVTITIPNDTLYGTRALHHLEAAGLIKLNPAINSARITVNDIIENPKNIVLQPIAARQLPISLDSAELAVVPGNLLRSSELEHKDALTIEEITEDFQTVIVIRSVDETEAFAKDLMDVVQSAEFKEIITAEFEDFIIED